MIMRPGQPLLLPANPLFIWGSLLAALGLNMMRSPVWGERSFSNTRRLRYRSFIRGRE